MIYCTSCGSPNPAGAVVCDVCGASLPRTGAVPAATPPPPAPPPHGPQQPHGPPRQPPPSSDALSGVEQAGIFLGNLCLSPLLGVVLYFVWRERQPRRAGQACTLSWWAVGIWAVFFLLAMLAGLASAL